MGKHRYELSKKILEKTQLYSAESLISLHLLSLYTNFPLKKDLEIAMRRLFAMQTNLTERSIKIMKKQLIFAVKKVHFKLLVCGMYRKTVCPGCQKR